MTDGAYPVAAVRAATGRARPSASRVRAAHALRSLAFVLLALLPALFLAQRSIAQELVAVPPLQARVNDLTGTLSGEQRASIEAELAALEARKGSQIAILIVPTTQPEPIEQYAIRVAEQWQIGRGEVDGRRVDDGVLIVVAKNDRRVRIEVGYGLEGAIPDAYARRIIDESIAPRFRQGDYAGGLRAAVDDLARLIEGEPLPPAWSDGRGGSQQPGTDWVALLLGAFVVGLIVRSIFGRVFGSMLGGALGGVAAWAGGASALLAAAAGFFLFLVLLSMFSTGVPMGRTGRHTWRSGPGGFPGGWGRGGFGGGGFRGGGGGFGGGGASGGW